jgi:hypothetical protein
MAARTRSLPTLQPLTVARLDIRHLREWPTGAGKRATPAGDSDDVPGI